MNWKICVGAVGVEVEEIGQAHFAEAEFEAALGKFSKEGVGSAVGSDFLAAEGNDLVPHEARDVGSFAERGVADDVEVEEAGDAEGFAEAVAAGFLDVAEELGRFRDAQSGVESEHARTGVLRFGREAILSLVGRMKRGMPLGNKIGLAGKPQAVPLCVRKHDHGRIIRRRGGSVGGSRLVVCGARRFLGAEGESGDERKQEKQPKRRKASDTLLPPDSRLTFHRGKDSNSVAISDSDAASVKKLLPGSSALVSVQSDSPAKANSPSKPRMEESIQIAINGEFGPPSLVVQTQYSEDTFWMGYFF